MKLNLIKTAVTAFSIVALAVACHKKTEDKSLVNPDDTSQQLLAANDEANVSNTVEATVEDVNNVVSGTSTANNVNARTEQISICGVAVDSSAIASGVIKLTYDGYSTCLNGRRVRSGLVTISISPNTKWTDAGAVLTLTFSGFKSTRVSDGKSITINGTKTITNVSGGLIKNMTNGSSPIVHKIRGTMSITFDDNTQRTWQIARRRTTTLTTSGVYNVTTIGDTTVAGVVNTDLWGINRLGDAFYGVISEPIVFSSSCGYDVISGQKIHKGLVRDITTTYGLDQNGNPVSAGTCPSAFSVQWVNLSGVARDVLVTYN
jgi:hypothetical protein